MALLTTSVYEDHRQVGGTHLDRMQVRLHSPKGQVSTVWWQQTALLAQRMPGGNKLRAGDETPNYIITAWQAATVFPLSPANKMLRTPAAGSGFR